MPVTTKENSGMNERNEVNRYDFLMLFIMCAFIGGFESFGEIVALTDPIRSALFIIAGVFILITILIPGDFKSLFLLGKEYLPYNADPICTSKNLNRLNIVTDGESWYDKYDFSISLSGYRYGVINMRNLGDKINSWPILLRMPLWIWIIIVSISAIVNLFFYVTVSKYINPASMTPQAYKLVDNLMFYLPSIIYLFASVSLFAVQFTRFRILRKYCIQVVDENKAQSEIKSTKQDIYDVQKLRWYYNTCPNCTTEAAATDIRCSSCGSPLTIPDIREVMPLDRHQVIDQ